METVVGVPNVRFNDGNTCPVIGFGIGVPDDDNVRTLTERAIDLGYRYIDCGYVDQKEKEIGLAISNKIAQGVVKREDLFISSKLWNTFHHPSVVLTALRLSLNNLGLSYLDLYLMHWPFAFKEGKKLIPIDADNNIIFDESVDFVVTWKCMEILKYNGLVKSIGVCNFNVEQLLRIVTEAVTVPVVNQIECHPFLNQWDVHNFCMERGIFVASYYPYGHLYQNWSSFDITKPYPPEKLAHLCTKYKKSPYQILLRYQFQLSHTVIVTPLKEDTMIDNMGAFDFQLDEEDMEYLKTLEANERVLRFERAAGHKDYPFTDIVLN